MKVRVLFFARARELAATGAADLDIPPGATLRDLREILRETYPSLAGLLERSLLAVNQEYAGNDRILADNDEIACVPPVSGG